MQMQADTGHYRRLFIMAALHFIAMYALMYAMVNVFANVHHNLNQVYMATLMTASMLLIELPLMRAMYPSRRRNYIIGVVAVLALAGSFLGIRRQTAIGDRQFLKSMIPHHAGAILMCEHAAIADAQVRELCEGIIASQQAEIEQMNGILERMAGR